MAASSIVGTDPANRGGNLEDPFLITTAEELKWYADYVNGESGDGVVHNTACAKLMNDIDLSTVCGEGKGNWTPIAKYGVYNYEQDPRFEGTFDGNGFTIENLYINIEGGEKLALFGYICPSTEKISIQNLKLKNVYVYAQDQTSSLCVIASAKSTIRNIEVVSGNITSTNSEAAGITNDGGNLDNCINRANVTCNNMYSAGICGYILGTITKCSNYGKISSNRGLVGGICATSRGFTTLTDCINYGDLVTEQELKSTDYGVGGVLGKAWNIKIKNCANFGKIYVKSASNYVGSIVGCGQLMQADGIWANAGNIYVDNVAQADVPVFPDNITWYNNEVSNNATCITPTTEQLASGYLAYLLQQNCTEPTWGQNITTDPKDALPIIGGATVYAETSCTSNEPTSFNNSASIVNHNITHHEGVAPTCTEAGSIEYWSCSDCGKMWSDEALTTLVEETTLAALSHTKDQEVAAVEPTCTTTGNTAYYHCSTCNKYFSTETNEEIAENAWVISAKGHSTELNHVAAKTATCTEQGNHEYWYCNDCQTYFKEETCENAFTDDDNATTGVWIAMIPHAYTYTSNGNSTHDAICSVCQHEVHGEHCLFGMADQTCSKCLFALLDDFTIEDEEVYARANTANVSNLTYNRTFKGTNWTTWYVPFELTLTPELCEKYAFSRINNVHQYDDNNDGTADRTIVESFKQTEGVTLKANYPYLVRALTDADKSMTLTLDDVTLCKAEDKSIECMSIDYVYAFTGSYQGVGESGTAADSPLSLFDYSDENKWYNFHSLPAQRHYLTITPRNGSTALYAPARILLQVIGEETSTGIVNLYNAEKRSTETYDLSGRRVNGNQRGLLIKNGKKVIVK